MRLLCIERADLVTGKRDFHFLPVFGDERNQL
jgi:hypothetical protein